VIVSTHLITAGYAVETPTIEFTSEACEFGLFEVARQHLGFKLLFLEDNEALAVGKPTGDVRVLVGGENSH